MIPLHKLQSLPRTLRLRKAASIFGAAERSFAAWGKLEPDEKDYLDNIIKLLIDNENFPLAAMEALKAARESLSINIDNDSIEDNKKEIRRALNTVHHILLSITGRYTADWDYVDESGVLDAAKRRPFPGMQAYLEDIRSPHNVGGMFRAAESFGAEKIWLSPLCADPRHKRAERTAMGCVDILPWERVPCDPFSCDSFSLAGPFFALETGGITLEEFSFPQRGIMIAGSEELGVSPPALAAADASLGRVSIASYGAKGSLNVSVAFGIVMQAWASALNKGY